MKIIKPYAEILYMDDPKEAEKVFEKIENAGRTCYKSTSEKPGHAVDFTARVVKQQHEAMLEHAGMTVRFVVDRGVSHELVRHRMASFAQESTRYCNYSQDKFGNEITFIKPCFLTEDGNPRSPWGVWYYTMLRAESAYLDLVNNKGMAPQEARCVLPHSLKTEVVMTANFREWRHFFRLRAACETGPAHPQMLEVAVPLFQKCQKMMPELFYDIEIPREVLQKYGCQED